MNLTDGLVMCCAHLTEARQMNAVRKMEEFAVSDPATIQ